MTMPRWTIEIKTLTQGVQSVTYNAHNIVIEVKLDKRWNIDTLDCIRKELTQLHPSTPIVFGNTLGSKK